MLPSRSILLQVCLLLIVRHCNGQDYEYGVDESDHSDINDDSDHPDYSKYYSVDTSAPLVSSEGNSGFTSPIEFSGFFGPPIEFGASAKQEITQPKNPFVAKETKTVGFVDDKFPSEFFSSSTYHPKDYFEESQKQQQKENQEEEDGDHFDVSPGPSYISHQLPAKYSSIEGGYSSEVEHIDEKTPKYKNNNKKSNRDYDEDYEKSSAEADKYKIDDYDYSSPTSGKYTDYNVGKSSSTVSQQPAAPGYSKFTATPTATPYQKYSFQPVTEGFESRYLQGLISTVAPFNPAYNKIATTIATPLFETQSSEQIPSHLQGKGCKRVKKDVDEKDFESGKVKTESMNCFVCQDPKTGSKYTQCSYTSEPSAKNEYTGKSERYSTPGREPDGFRYKRYSGDDYNVDPYEYIKKRSQAAYHDSDPNEEVKDYGEYKIPDYYYSDGPDKSFSELQSEEIAKNPANCFKEEKSGMTCTICKDPKTGGNFEQCSYTSEPKEQKYAYVAEKKYDSNDAPEEGSESKPAAQKAKKLSDSDSLERFKAYNPAEEFKKANQETLDLKYKPIVDFNAPRKEEQNNYKSASQKEEYIPSLHSHKSPSRKEEEFPVPHHSYEPASQEEEYSAPVRSYKPESHKEEYTAPAVNKGKPLKKLVDDDPYDIPKHFAESTINEKKTHAKKVEPSSAESEDYSESADSSDISQPYKDIDEYHFKLFPEFTNEESQQAEVIAENPSAETTRKDVEEVLAEFSKKDRSACKKAEKKGMTCYLCVDEKGIQHEECMYVSESKPQASHVAYHEVKQIKSPDGVKKEQLEPAATEIKRKRFFKKVTTPAPFTLEGAASEEVETKVKYTNNKPTKNRKRNLKKSNKNKNKEQESASTNIDSERLEDDDEHPPPKTPVEFEVGEKEGAFSEETKPVYSKRHGVKLPKYMLEKSEFEQDFDEFSGVTY